MNTSINTLRETRRSLVSALADTEQTMMDAKSSKSWSVFGHAVMVKGQVERELSRINSLIRQEEDKERAALKRAQAVAAQAASKAMEVVSARKRAESEARLKAMRQRQALIERMMSVLYVAQEVVKASCRNNPTAPVRRKQVKTRRQTSTACLFAFAGLSL